MAPALTDDLAEIVLSVTMLGDQLVIPKRLFQRIEVGALDILDDRQLERRAIIDIAHDHRDLDQPAS